jgi:mannose-6-phosphate isomerase-like protein (cupin superfamily)
MSGQLGDFHHEYLVTHAMYSSDWPSWEVHPNGDEIVMLLSGRATMVLEAQDGSQEPVVLDTPGCFAFVPRGTWHTAKIHAEGEGTRGRPA